MIRHLFKLTLCLILYAFRVDGQCVMIDMAGFKGKDVSSAPQFTTSPPTGLEDCKANCLAESACLATEFRSNFCLNWYTDPEETADSGFTISIKDCSPVEVSCSMTQTANTDASNFAFEKSITSYENCRDVCKDLSQCQHAVYITASNTCHLYNTTDSTSSQSGYISLVKKNCVSGGEFCCFDEFTDQSRSDTPTLTFTTSLNACDELCLAVDACNASVFTGTSCKILTQSPVTTSVSGRTLSQKSCPAGASTGDLTYVETCNNGVFLAPITALMLSLSVMALLTSLKS